MVRAMQTYMAVAMQHLPSGGLNEGASPSGPAAYTFYVLYLSMPVYISVYLSIFIRVCLCVCVRACVRVCACVCV